MSSPRRAVGPLILLAVLAGCSPGAEPVPAPPPVTTSAPAAAPTPPPAPTVAPAPARYPADGSDVSACADGECQIEVRGRVDVPFPAFGITRWRLEPDSYGISYRLQPESAVRQVNGGVGDGNGTRGYGSVRPEVGEVFAGGLVMRLLESDGSRAVVEFRRGGPTVPGL